MREKAKIKIFIKPHAERIDDEERNESRLKLITITQMVRWIVTRKEEIIETSNRTERFEKKEERDKKRGWEVDG